MVFVRTIPSISAPDVRLQRLDDPLARLAVLRRERGRAPIRRPAWVGAIPSFLAIASTSSVVFTRRSASGRNPSRSSAFGLAALLEVVVPADPGAADVLARLVHQAVDLALDQHRGQREIVRRDDLVEQLGRHLPARVALDGLVEAALDLGAQIVQRLRARDALGELVVERGQLGLFDLVNRDREDRVLAGEVGVGVRVREVRRGRPSSRRPSCRRCRRRSPG